MHLRALFITIAALFLICGGPPSQAQVQGLGVVLLHGKQDTPAALSGLANALRSQGAIVVTPDMPWSSRRIYDAGWTGAIHEIADALRQTKSQGATRFVVGGHSIGGTAAMAFARVYPKLAGVIALAPGHVPEGQLFKPATASSVAKAREMVSSGRGDETASFTDINMSEFTVRAKARNILNSSIRRARRPSARVSAVSERSPCSSPPAVRTG